MSLLDDFFKKNEDITLKGVAVKELPFNWRGTLYLRSEDESCGINAQIYSMQYESIMDSIQKWIPRLLEIEGEWVCQMRDTDNFFNGTGEMVIELHYRKEGKVVVDNVRAWIKENQQ